MERLNRERILFLMGFFTDLPDEKLARLTPLCEGAAVYIESRLLPDANVNSNMEALCTAAAAWAAEQYMKMSKGNEEEVRVGDIALRSSQRGGTAGLWSGFAATVSHLMRPEGFAFSAIEEPA
jgi:hypothetical protein